MIKELMQHYDMEHSLQVFSSESNQKNPPKREVLSLKNNIAGGNDKEPLLLNVMQKFMKKSKVKVPKEEKKEKK